MGKQVWLGGKYDGTEVGRESAGQVPTHERTSFKLAGERDPELALTAAEVGSLTGSAELRQRLEWAKATVKTLEGRATLAELYEKNPELAGVNRRPPRTFAILQVVLLFMLLGAVGHLLYASATRERDRAVDHPTPRRNPFRVLALPPPEPPQTPPAR